MRRNRSAAFLAIVATAAALAVACSSSSSSSGHDTWAAPAMGTDETGPPIDFPLPRSYIPSSDFCCVYVPSRPELSFIWR
jgi:hypothetical protein